MNTKDKLNNIIIDEKEYNYALKEVFEIIQLLPEETYNKIPTSLIQIIKENMQKDYEYYIQDLENIEMLEITKAILAIIYRDYLATEEVKKNIKEKEMNERVQIEKDKIEKYNAEKLFSNVNQTQVEIHYKCNNTDMIIYKENIFKKILLKIKQYFSNKKK